MDRLSESMTTIDWRGTSRSPLRAAAENLSINNAAPIVSPRDEGSDSVAGTVHGTDPR